MRLLKLVDKYTGWVSEGSTKQLGRRFFKRLEHRYNRRNAKLHCRRECND